MSRWRSEVKDVARFIVRDLLRDKDFLVILGMWAMAFLIAIMYAFK